MKIDSADIRVFKIPLRKPYILSFTTIHHIVSNVIRIASDNGDIAIGEAVALEGYSDETQDEVFLRLRKVADAINQCAPSLGDAEELTNNLIQEGSFAASAVRTALDLLARKFQPPSYVHIPVVGVISSDSDSFITETGKLIDKGHGTIKVKIGKHLQRDIECAKELIHQYSSYALFRFDANQAYSPTSAQKFLTALSGAGSHCVELVEQPLPIDQWEHMAELVKLSPVPLMLDESIYGKEDVKKAATIGVPYVKLKLFKHSGIVALLDVAAYARSMGMKVILGNGVATDIGNLAEVWTYSSSKDLFYGACEANGFSKLEFQCLQSPPVVKDGSIHWECPKNYKEIQMLNQKNIQF